MVRLSYQRLPNGNYVSNLIPLQTMLVYALINANSLSYEIRYVSDDEVGVLDCGDKYQSIKKIKLDVRIKLSDLGVVFKDEIRNKV